MDFDAFSFAGRRSNVMARRGVVATSQPLAAQAGLSLLQQGGNALDAAIATVAALCVVEPTSTGAGGDAFALIWSAEEQRLYGLNASGPAPQALTAEWVRAQGYDTMPERGAIPVTVPGSVRGWEAAMQRFGSLDLAQVLRPAMEYARDGFPVSEIIAGHWRASETLMSRHPVSHRVWLPGGHAPRPGHIFRNPDFARTLQQIAQQGPDVFYDGPIAQQIVDTVQEAGGVLTADDLAQYRPQWVEPISGEYRRGFTFHEIPPNGQGLTALLALNIARGFDLPALAYDDPQRVHLLVEAMKLAFADAAAYIADPRQVDVPLAGLLSESYTAQRRALVDSERARTPQPGQPARHGDTVYLATADEAGNMVSWIQSLYMGFGSGLTAGDTGVQLQNRGANFSLKAGHPNEVAPGKRPYHTIIPGFITRDGAPWATFGVMGGFMQPQGHLQVGVNLVDYGMDPQAALDAPRFRWLDGLRVALEDAFGSQMREALTARGHTVTTAGSYGGGQIILRDPQSGVLIAGSDPRKDGAAVGW
ncbi:MAG: gamma-glutamyltransferase [Chloroflexota bacterium]